MSQDYIPFCGLPPAPAELWSRWLFDPLLMGLLALFAAALALRARDRRTAALAWGLTALLFISPLCAASMALFSARVAQHLALTLVVAPLLARAAPLPGRSVLPPVLLFALLFWLWHSPLPYGATYQSDLAYWAMHLSLLGTAWWLWSRLAELLGRRPDAVALGLALTAGQMTILSALLIFAREPWHAWHLTTTLPYGFSPLADQQLAGALMWVGGGALMLAAVALLMLRLLRHGSPATGGRL
jgi:putative membrane protein